MGQFARTFQPRLARASIAQGELFFDGLRNELAQWNPQRTSGGLGLAEGWVRDLQRRLHDVSIPYLWEAGAPDLAPSRLRSLSGAHHDFENYRMGSPAKQREPAFVLQVAPVLQRSSIASRSAGTLPSQARIGG